MVSIEILVNGSYTYFPKIDWGVKELIYFTERKQSTMKKSSSGKYLQIVTNPASTEN
jgi:hypothetical protein